MQIGILRGVGRPFRSCQQLDGKMAIRQRTNLTLLHQQNLYKMSLNPTSSRPKKTLHKNLAKVRLFINSSARDVMPPTSEKWTDVCTLVLTNTRSQISLKFIIMCMFANIFNIKFVRSRQPGIISLMSYSLLWFVKINTELLRGVFTTQRFDTPV